MSTTILNFNSSESIKEKNNKIAILNAGSQYTKLIDCKVRALNCETDVFELDVEAEHLRDFSGVVITGGPDSVYEKDAVVCDKKIFELGIPVLGICYGCQLICHLFGGKVARLDQREDGQLNIHLDTESRLFKNLDSVERVLLTHGDSVSELPENFVTTSISENEIVSSIEHVTKRIYGLQFHPEVELTPNGTTIFKNFVLDICGVTPSFSVQGRLLNFTENIKNAVGNKTVIALMSGGVDSSVCLALLRRALPDPDRQIRAVHFDTGFLRKREHIDIDTLNKLGFNIEIIDSKPDFFNGKTVINGVRTKMLRDTVDPEERRKIIGDTFMHVVDRYFQRINLNKDDCLLVQGTLRPDLIESASKLASHKAATIKTHHNDTQLVRDMRDKGLILEPLKDLHKDEVRQLGLELGLPYGLVYKHPYPGPGLAVRMILSEPLDLDACILAENELEGFLLENRSERLDVAILPIRSVGIQGDCRAYNYTAVVSVKKSNNESVISELDDVYKLAIKIPHTVKKVNRVILDVGSIVGFTDNRSVNRDVTLNEEYTDLLRDIDHFINMYALEYNITVNVAQMPIVLIPVGGHNMISVVIRPVITSNFMTASPYRPPLNWLKTLFVALKSNFNRVSNLYLDLTSKPPGTIEWL